MKRIAFAEIGLCVLASAFLAGCLNSEGDYNRLTEERDALSAELAAARQENEILTAALGNIAREKERLEMALKPYQPAPAAGSSASGAEASALAGGEEETAAPAAAGDGRVHVAQRGDTLSNIATHYNTTLNDLLELNPYLKRRDGYMVWENDNIQLPGQAGQEPPAAPAEVF